MILAPDHPQPDDSSMTTASHRLLIVDDSAIIRKTLRQLFSEQANIDVIGEAVNGRDALKVLPHLKPDVISLDVKMPVMDGLTTLKHIMIQQPTPTVMVSAFTKEGAVTTFDALKYGAADFIPKPSRFMNSGIEDQNQMIVRKIVQAAKMQMEAVKLVRTKPPLKTDSKNNAHPLKSIVAMGAAEGGYGSLLKIVPQINKNISAALIIILYEASPYVDAFVRYLDAYSELSVERPQNGKPLSAGVCHIGSAEEYITIDTSDSNPRLHVQPAPFQDRRGAINMLMFSVAEMMQQHGWGVVLSGAGVDGAEGMTEISRSKGKAIILNPGACLHSGMARAAKISCPDAGVCSDHTIVKEINEKWSK